MWASFLHLIPTFSSRVGGSILSFRGFSRRISKTFVILNASEESLKLKVKETATLQKLLAVTEILKRLFAFAQSDVRFIETL